MGGVCCAAGPQKKKIIIIIRKIKTDLAHMSTFAQRGIRTVKRLRRALGIL